MKRLLAFLLCLTALLFLDSCKKEPLLTLSGPSTLDLGADGGSGSITFTSNSAWTATPSDSWVSVSPASGQASDSPITISVKVERNTGYDNRSATVRIDANGLTQSVTLHQQAGSGLMLPTASYGISSDAQTLEVEVLANVEYSVTVSDGWIKQAGTKALASNKLVFNVEENASYDERSATITIDPKDAGLEKQVISVSQAARPGLTVPTKSYELASDAHTINVEVQANVEYTVSVSAKWIKQVQTKGLTSTTLVFNVEENGSYDDRSATITVKPQVSGLQEQVISVHQAQKDALLVQDTSYGMPYGGGEIEFVVKTNVSYEVTSDADWIWFTQTKALSSSTVVLKVAENPTYQSREGKVKVVQTDGSLSVTVTVRQDGRIAVSEIRLDKTSLELPAGESETIVATVYPDNATDKVVSWSSDAPEVATVDAEGSVTAVAVGSATITATAGDKSASAQVTVIRSIYETEREVLMALYDATGGDNWVHRDNWGSDEPLDQWYGIWTYNGHVSHIMMSQNNLTGHIPPEVFSLPGMIVFDLDYNYVTGPIPEEIGNAKKLTTLRLQHNQLTGPIPESLYDLTELWEIQLWTNKLTGELSERFWDMPALTHLAVDDNKITGQLTPAVKKAKGLTWLGVGSNLLTGTIPEEITELERLTYFSTENHPVSNGSVTEAANEFSGRIPENLDKLQNLNYFLVENNNLEGSLPACLGRMPKLVGLEIYGNRLSGEIPMEVVDCANWDTWAPDANIMPQQEGYVLSFSHYESTDFSADGKVTKLQTHEKGNGINVIITGDCFTDKDIAAGKFDGIANQTMEDFFAVEPFTTFRNLFDVYSVTAVSKTAYSSYGTALGALFGEGTYVYCDEDLVREYSSKAVDNLDETITIVIVNKNRNSGTAYMPYPNFDTDYGSGFSYACFGLQDQGDNRRLLINHEANGHGFTKLQDEYFYAGSGTFPESSGQYLKEVYQARGYYNNVDVESDPAKVSWSWFLSDERYKYDGLGVFEGGMVCEKGIWRPSENSIMRYQQVGYDGDRFNAPSRAAAYKRIHKLAYGNDWQFDYEEFAQYDAVNRKTAADNATLQASASNARPRIGHTPPVMLKPRKVD